MDDITTKNKLQKIIRFKNPLKIYLNKWKDEIMDVEEIKTTENGIKKIVKKKKIILKRNKDEKTENDKEPKKI